VDKKRPHPNRDQQQLSKLKFQYKKEFKGAIRELRKDADFIAREKVKQKREEDAAYQKKMNTIMGQLAEQEGAMRGYEKVKKKK
jgi:nucleolar protein 14